MTLAASSLYNDVQGLNSLKHQVRLDPTSNLEEVAAQFESVFVQMMVKSMRDATIEGELFSSDQMDTYQQMFDKQLSLDLSRQGGLGLAQILVDQLGGNTAREAQTPESGAAAAETVPAAAPSTAPTAAQVLPFARPASIPSAATNTAPVHAPLRSAANPEQWQPASPQEFIAAVWQHAVDAAAELGVDPEVLVAQSALETGWGKKVIRTADGGSSYNLFGIKASGGWEGRSASVNTLEYRDGVAQQERAAFRAYDSLAGSFNDYVALLKESPRYSGALETARDGRAFVQGLQDAGYATDPLYADKIMGILESDKVTDFIAQLKNS
tara:strand:+ start:23427 stop:24404 length:978 start_codon:yes stop_codon:yes gene_type:complete